MAVEVIEMAPGYWNVYHSFKEEPCTCSPEWRATHRSGCGEVQLCFYSPEAASHMASWLRTYPDAYMWADAHWTTEKNEPLYTRKCGCHEDERHLWNPVCPYSKAHDAAVAVDIAKAHDGPGVNETPSA